MALKIGVFGGAFDPPHLAHQALAEAALLQLGLDVLHIVPTGQAWHKARTLSDAADRLAMCRLAFGGLAQGATRLVFDEREIRRAGPSYTIDTLRELRAEYPGAEFFLVLGQDQAEALTTWNDWQTVVALALICHADRDWEGRAQSFTPPQALASRYRKLQMPLMQHSATGVRAEVAANPDVPPDLRLLVSPAVAGYIETHHLYQTT
ncbi:nicotinate-nucleotide adenylyltransferase [Hylemonella gracilis str. Niagara R]|uniref:Probable nicotinate-nucleotide adenylyltransferase n=1 Tax=Hylemonella gracilis str. Niagara R TaxID=1458275 RepID=A0A016XHZ0_9BURK|nr:nicotinate (nicotinamide) nucleotide adenylyltransferase [Hylemonella gracilis]EYC51505.1 nicotinate-nucleotide adenylyltransferase [Hylemonella gracilis str. Niagara R]